jgi:hypothetical protein
MTMLDGFRHFEVADPQGRVWNVEFQWIQNAISIRHADAIDVRFSVSCGEESGEKVVALVHPLLLDLSKRMDHPVTDPWCSRLAAAHIKHVIETGEDMDKVLITPGLDALERHAQALTPAAVRR